MQRIWNEEELKCMSEFIRKTGIISGEYWIKEGCHHAIAKNMVGKTIDYCKDKGRIVLDWMIAKEPKEESIFVKGSDNSMSTAKVVFQNSDGSEILKLRDDNILSVNLNNLIEKNMETF